MSLESILNEYNENTKKQSNGTFDLNNYFAINLEKNEDEAFKRVRILPGEDGTPFTTIWLHQKKVDGQWRKFVCPAKMKGEKCPFCTSYDYYKKNGTDEQKKNAYQYRARKAYVLKVIDRDKEAEGPKFWRFFHNSKKKGLYDSIISMFKMTKCDMSDPDEGRDIDIHIGRNDDGYATIMNMQYGAVSKLSEDEDQVEEWLNHELTWKDVYAQKSFDYLQIIVTNGKPVWDESKQKFVDEFADDEEEDDNDELDNKLNSITMSGKKDKPKKIEVGTEDDEDEEDAEDSEDDEDFDDVPF